MTQPNPIQNDNPSIHDLVMVDLNPEDRLTINELKRRKIKGIETYRTILQANNGRDAFQDAIDELADAVVYLRQIIEEGKDDHQILYCYQSTIHNLQLLLAIQSKRNDLQKKIPTVDPSKTIPYLQEGLKRP